MSNPDVPQAVKFFDWAIRDAMPDWAAEMVIPGPRTRSSGPPAAPRRGRRSTARKAAMGPLREFRQARRRVAAGVVRPHRTCPRTGR